MNNKKSRSSLKKVATQADEEPDPARIIKRRISFSGKKFIREFDTTEKPRDYDNSYEISDHTNGDDSSGQSHGTVAASVLQSTSQISLANDMDKENIQFVQGAMTSGLLYDQHSRLSDFTLKLQTSINVTLLPDELTKSRQRMESPARLEVTSSDSLSLNDVERDKLRENSLYKMPVFEKTLDLVPKKLLEPTHLDKENIQKTIRVPANISCVVQMEKDVNQKTVIFENNDISCDFSNIEPPEISAIACPTSKPMQETDSFDMAEKDYMNYLPDDSTLSSPLIPLDVISENGISKKLNFRQLNDALNSGRIQLFPNGPKTPTTDRKAKQQRFWHGLEQQPMEQEREVIKPRGTLNFNESMMMSPAPQRAEPKLKTTADQSNQPVKETNSRDTRRNYRISQADELMLDNTNFLVHARMGDETQSRNSSKCSSRRETTYDNTAMELDDLEKHEAAVTALLETAKHKQTMHNIEAIEDDDFSDKNAVNEFQTAAVVDQRHSRTVALNELIDETHLKPHGKPNRTLHMAEAIEEVSFRSHNEIQASTKTQQSGHRQTLRLAEPIEEDIVTAQMKTAAAEEPYKVRRQTLNLTEAMDEDIAITRQEIQTNTLAPAINQQFSRRRQTLLMVDSIEEDSFCSHKEVGPMPTAASMQSNQNKRRQTLLLVEPIKEDIIGPLKESQPATSAVEQPYSIRRQTLHMADPIEEDSFYAQNSLKSIELHHGKHRQTLNMAEPIEEEIVGTHQELQETEEQCTRRQRQTLNLADSIEEDIVKPQKESAAVDQQSIRRRQTLHLADAMEEDSFCSMPKHVQQRNEEIDQGIVKSQEEPAVSLLKQQCNSRRQTLHMADPIEFDSFCSRTDNKHRQELQMDEAIVEDILRPQEDLKQQPIVTTVDQQSNSRRQTLHLTEAIDEDSFCSMPIGGNKSSQILQKNAEQNCKPHKELQALSVASSVEQQSRRQTLHLADPIDEDSICSRKGVTSMTSIAKKHTQVLQMEETIVEDTLKLQLDPNQTPIVSSMEQQSNSRRQTLHLADPIEEDSFRSMPIAGKKPSHILQINKTTEEEHFKLNKEASIVEQPSNSRRQTLHRAYPIEEDSFRSMPIAGNKSSHILQINKTTEEEHLKLNKEATIVEQPSNSRRQTLHRADSIEEDSFDSKSTAAPMETHSNKCRETLLLTEDIDEDEIKSQNHLQSKSAAPPVDKQRQTLLFAEPIQEDIFCAHKEKSSKSMHRQTINVDEPIEEVSCSALKDPSTNQLEKKAHQTYNMEEAIDVDISCIQSMPTFPPKPQMQKKPRHTVQKEVSIVEEMPKVEKAKSKPTLLLSESMEMDFLSQSINEDAERVADDCQSDSSEWLAQMRAKARQTCAKSMSDKLQFPSPSETICKKPASSSEDKENVYNRIVSRSSLETPKMNKTQHNLNSNFFPITPGRSMIEYEDLEEECKVESPAEPPAARSIYQAVNMELDMDTSSFGTPKQTASFNVKRLPIHLTPNLPEPKKRNTQLPVRMEEDNTSHLEMEVSAEHVEQLTPVRNRSRIPVLSKSVNSPWREAAQLDGTVQMVRAQMMRQARSHFETEITDQMKDTMKKAPIMYEDNPITISDVSSHFTAQRELVSAAEQPPKTSIDSSNEHCNKNYATAHQKFINLSGDTAIFAAAEIIDLESDDYEIDKTRLSLVSTLLDEEDYGDNKAASCSNNESESVADGEAEACLERLNPPALAGAADACKKCKHCRRSMDGATARINLSDSFDLPDWRELDVKLERLEALRQRPRLEDVHKYWELKKLERYSNVGDETAVNQTHTDINETNSLSLSQMLEMFNKKWKEYKQSCPKPKPVKIFVECLDASLRLQLPNWIFDYQLQFDRKYIFSHRKITTFRIVVNYEPLDLLESKIRVRSIQMETTNLIPMALWTVYEHLMDFQLKLNLPLNLDHLLDGNDVEAFVKFLQHIDRVCLEIESMCNNMHIMLSTQQARLLREPNRTVVRKTVRRFIKKEDEAYTRVEKTHFKIEIGNVLEISFKDILQPPLYQFDENIQFLPKGIGFLEAFLESPEKYLKSNVEQNI